MSFVKLNRLTNVFSCDSIVSDRTMEAAMLTEKIVEAINEWLLKGFEIEIYRKPDGTLNIKTVKKKRLNVE